MTSTLCRLVHRHTSMRSGKIDRNHAVFIERTREGDQLYSILATKSSSGSDGPVLATPGHRKQKRRQRFVNMWSNLILTGMFFFLLIVIAALAWLIISMKFRLESLEVKVSRIGSDVDSLISTQLTWASTQNTISVMSDQIKDLRSELSRSQKQVQNSRGNDLDSEDSSSIEALALLQTSVKELRDDIGALKGRFSAREMWSTLTKDKDVMLDITKQCQVNSTQAVNPEAIAEDSTRP